MDAEEAYYKLHPDCKSSEMLDGAAAKNRELLAIIAKGFKDVDDNYRAIYVEALAPLMPDPHKTPPASWLEALKTVWQR